MPCNHTDNFKEHFLFCLARLLGKVMLCSVSLTDIFCWSVFILRLFYNRWHHHDEHNSWAKAHSPRCLCKLSDLSRPGISEHYITFHSILRHLLPVLMGLECTGRDIKWQYLVLFFFIEAVSWILGNPNSHWHGVLPWLQQFFSLFHFMYYVSLSLCVCWLFKSLRVLNSTRCWALIF